MAMVDNVTKALMLDKYSIDGKTILLLQQDDSSPFLHSLLAQSAKMRRKILLVSFSQVLGYYHSIGTRLGWNSNMLLSSGQLQFIGGLQAVKDAFTNPESSNPFSFLNKSHSFSLSDLLLKVESILTSWHEEEFTFVLDELHYLCSIGVEMHDVGRFYQACHSLVQACPKGALIVSTGVFSQESEETQCSKLFAHWSDLVLTDKGLKTGRSKDVSGILAVNWKIPPFSEQLYHYKCFDRGIRMFAPGTAVL